MKYILYILRFLYRIRYWLIILPLLSAGYMIWKTRNLERTYQVNATIYTGVVSGYDMGQMATDGIDWNTKNSTIVNMMDLVKSEATLRKVSMRLLARCLMKGDPQKDNTYINASTYRWLKSRTPDYVLDLIVPDDENKTVENFFQSMKPTNTDYLYGLFMWDESKYFGAKTLNNIFVERIESSDMLKIQYKHDDPGITYNTVLILISEFSDQYQQLRFGETNNAIAYFQQELAEAGKKLREAEDELTGYNIEKKVINYIDETKEVASINKAFELQYQDVLMAHAKAEAAVKELEGRIDMNINNMRNNSGFLQQLNRISELQTQITNIESFGAKDETNKERVKTLQKELQDVEASVKSLTSSINENKYSHEGIVSSQFVDEWLMQTLELQKTTAQKAVMDQWKTDLDTKYTYYAPIGSTLKSKEREIDFTERTYLSLLEGLNAAILRLRQLQMTTNTLKVTDEAYYPISPLPHQRKMTVLIATVSTLIFVIMFFLLLELIDRTLRDRIRAERITNGKVLGVMPADTRRYRPLNQQAKAIATQFLAKATVPYFGTKQPVIINLLSTESGDGKHFLAQQLYEYWQAAGVQVKLCSYRTDFNGQGAPYIHANHLTDLYPDIDSGIVIVVYQPLSTGTVPSTLLKEANLNLIVVRSNRTWKNIDQDAYENLVAQCGDTPLFLVLNETGWDVTEDFTGLLPPYTHMRRWLYRLSQLGLTSKEVYSSDNQKSA